MKSHNNYIHTHVACKHTQRGREGERERERSHTFCACSSALSLFILCSSFNSSAVSSSSLHTKQQSWKTLHTCTHTDTQIRTYTHSGHGQCYYICYKFKLCGHSRAPTTAGQHMGLVTPHSSSIYWLKLSFTS